MKLAQQHQAAHHVVSAIDSAAGPAVGAPSSGAKPSQCVDELSRPASLQRFVQPVSQQSASGLSGTGTRRARCSRGARDPEVRSTCIAGCEPSRCVRLFPNATQRRVVSALASDCGVPHSRPDGVRCGCGPKRPQAHPYAPKTDCHHRGFVRLSSFESHMAAQGSHPPPVEADTPRGSKHFAQPRNRAPSAEYAVRR